ncbi:uncharacterized protein MONBRDRAFT_9628 [Monosiga brevicollis MX1]|uniref:Uncharacterized protein n=1 Tax=Monosiga brevicollis TaxID=81824 RepID=A9V3W7_MONBE|nr:uncharacterized protein MONBRDRAFT_9628 [Monosiga brevicollis MX1]EDQ87783.1 predicted protein [Monosiga brevicollis MX1]|eukprot:XP_001747316.1 hypothetical protein [Monosiga brevicollis MX1]
MAVIYGQALILTAGGSDNVSMPTAGLVDVAEYFDGTVHEAVETMTPLAMLSAGVGYHNEFYVMGGLGGDQAALHLVNVFDGQRWYSAPQMTRARAGAATAVFQDRIYVIGGQTSLGEAGQASYEVFDGARWTLYPLDFNVTGATAGVFGGQLYLIGGYIAASNSPTDLVWRLNGSAFVAHSRLPVPLAIAAAATFQAQLVVLGGVNAHKQQSPLVFAMDGEEQWRQWPSMVEARSSLCATVLRGKLYAMFGRGANGSATALEAFDGKAWRAEPLADNVPPRFGAACSTLVYP